MSVSLRGEEPLADRRGQRPLQEPTVGRVTAVGPVGGPRTERAQSAKANHSVPDFLGQILHLPPPAKWQNPEKGKC